MPNEAPKSTCASTRTMMMKTPRRRKNPKERAQGASGLRADTTIAAQHTIKISSSGLVVRLAAAARPSAQAHHAPGCNHRGMAAAPSANR